jgi:hypothetical protein
MHDPITLYRFALRAGDRPLADALARALSGDPELSARADLALRQLPRGPAGWSEPGERAVQAVLRRLGALLLL